MALLSIQIIVASATASTRVAVTTPLINVKEGDMLSIHCQVWNHNEDDHKITISKKMEETSKMETLTWDQAVQQDMDDRFFLATRRFDDGSVVYFMSIIDVVREDSGLYYCKVVSTDPFAEISTDFVNVDINYFPAMTFPICSPSGPITLIVGSKVVVNCSSEIGYPAVDLKWYRSRDEQIHGTRQYNSSDLVVSELLISSIHEYQDALLVCKLTSPAFPNYEESCHIGPIQIISADNQQPNPPMLPNLATSSNNQDSFKSTPETAVTIAIYSDGSTEQCSEVCPATLQSPVMYWIVATVFIGLLALIFLLITIMLAARLCGNNPQERNRQYVRNAHKRTVEELYEKLECRRDDQTLYMSLQRPRKPDNLVVLRGRDLEGNYTGTPTVPTM